jgi:hypothetical protein
MCKRSAATRRLLPDKAGEDRDGCEIRSGPCLCERMGFTVALARHIKDAPAVPYESLTSGHFA